MSSMQGTAMAIFIIAPLKGRVHSSIFLPSGRFSSMVMRPTTSLWRSTRAIMMSSSEPTARAASPKDSWPPSWMEHGLSEREAEVLSLVVMKKTNQEIADELVLAVGTIKSHVHNLVKKTGTKNREDLIVDFWQS